METVAALGRGRSPGAVQEPVVFAQPVVWRLTLTREKTASRCCGAHYGHDRYLEIEFLER
jgi:hypothetical protein